MTITMLMTMIKTIWSEWIVNLTSTRRRQERKREFLLNKIAQVTWVLSEILTLLNKDIKWLNLITSINPFIVWTGILHMGMAKRNFHQDSFGINTCKEAIYILLIIINGIPSAQCTSTLCLLLNSRYSHFFVCLLPFIYVSVARLKNK